MTSVDPDQLLLFPELATEEVEEVADDRWKLVVHAETSLDLPASVDPEEVVASAQSQVRGLLLETWVRKPGRGARRHHLDGRYEIAEVVTDG